MTTPARTRPVALATAALAMALVMAVLVVVPVALAAGTARVQPSGRTQGSPPSAIPMPQPVSNPGVTLKSQTTFVGAGDTFSMVIELANATPDTRFSIALHPAVTSRIQFGQTLGGQQLGTPVQQFDGVAVSDLPVDATGATNISLLVPGPDVVPGPFTLLVTEPGVYPITVTVDDDPAAVPLVTHVVRLGVPDAAPNAGPDPDPNTAPDDPAFSVGVLLNVAGSGDLDGLTTALTTYPGVPVTVRAQPERLAALVSSGPAGAASVRGLGAAIGNSEVLLDTWVPVDMASLVASTLDQFIDRQLLTGASTLQQLLNTTVSGATWVMDPTVDPAALAALTKRGVQQVVIPEQLAEPIDSNRFPVTLTRPFTVEAGNDNDDPALVPAMQTDVVLTALLESSGQPALAANRVLADLAVLAFDLSNSGRAAIVDTEVANVPGATIAAVLSGLQDAARRSDTIEPLLQARTIGGLFATASAVGELDGEDDLVRSWTFGEPESLGTFPDQLADVDADTATLIGTVIPGPLAPEANATVERVNRLVLASGQRTLDADGRTDLLDQAALAIDGALAPIGVPEQGSVTLTADAGVIPVTLQNGRADPVRVRLQLTSDKLDFPDGDTLELILEPGTNRREVAVRVRASGGFPVEIQLSTPNDAIQLGEGRFTVRSTAISGTGLALSIVAGVFLAGWWALHFRSARRSKQLVAVDQSTPVDQSGPQPPNP
jgi:hypothetical protein